jgi:hypothetical protein
MHFTSEQLFHHREQAIELQTAMGLNNDIKQGHESCPTCCTGIYNPDIQDMLFAAGLIQPVAPIPKPIPVIPTVQEAEAHAKDQRCAMCLEDFENNDNLINKLKACGHFFHPTCIQSWMTVKFKCPICREDIV